MEIRKSKAVAFLLSAILTIIIVGSMIVIDEMSSAFKLFMNSLTGHHWVTKGVFSATLFILFSVVFYIMLRSEKARKILRTDNIWAWSLLLVVVTSIFFLASLINYIINYII